MFNDTVALTSNAQLFRCDLQDMSVQQRDISSRVTTTHCTSLEVSTSHIYFILKQRKQRTCCKNWYLCYVDSWPSAGEDSLFFTETLSPSRRKLLYPLLRLILKHKIEVGEPGVSSFSSSSFKEHEDLELGRRQIRRPGDEGNDQADEKEEEESEETEEECLWVFLMLSLGRISMKILE